VRQRVKPTRGRCPPHAEPILLPGVNPTWALLGKGGQLANNSIPHRRRALIVDDEIWFAISLQADMRELGYDICDLAANGQQAFLCVMSDLPDVVVMDVNLEGSREGIEAGRWLREVCDVPIVFLTGYGDRDTIERIHKQVPGAPVLSKVGYHHRLAGAVSTVVQSHH
jgi:DNA-binding NarL/FixJ family response regulator